MLLFNIVDVSLINTEAPFIQYARPRWCSIYKDGAINGCAYTLNCWVMITAPYIKGSSQCTPTPIYVHTHASMTLHNSQYMLQNIYVYNFMKYRYYPTSALTV